jgi:hypothetical protein
MEIVYVNTEAPGAWRNGTRVRKCTYEVGDGHRRGAVGTVVGSIGPVPHVIMTSTGEVRKLEYFYFVVFDNEKIPVGMVDFKLQVLQ